MSTTAQSAEKLRRASYETWEAITPGWERQRAWVEGVAGPVREWLLRELAPQAGETILELAAGPGETGFSLAASLGEEGRLISTDFSPAMVELARRRGQELGIDNVEHRVIDAERIDLESDSIDGVLCRYGFMLMVDRAAALAETNRVLKPGGRLVLSVWAAPERNPYFSVLAMTLVEAGHMPPPDPEGPGIFSMGGEEHTRGLLEAAGFDQLRLEDVAVRFSFADLDEYLAIAIDTAGPIAMVLRELSEEALATLRSELQPRLEPFAAGGGYQVPGVTLCGAAVAR